MKVTFKISSISVVLKGTVAHMRISHHEENRDWSPASDKGGVHRIRHMILAVKTPFTRHRQSSTKNPIDGMLGLHWGLWGLTSGDVLQVWAVVECPPTALGGTVRRQHSKPTMVSTYSCQLPRLHMLISPRMAIPPKSTTTMASFALIPWFSMALAVLRLIHPHGDLWAVGCGLGASGSFIQCWFLVPGPC